MQLPDETPAGSPEETDGSQRGESAAAATDAAAADADFFIVGIGASAGALEPISIILRRLPTDCNLAVVVVQHLDPNHESILVELLSRATNLPVNWVADGRTVAAGNIYVAPPKSCVSIERGILQVREAGREKSVGDIDYFLSSLASDAKDRAIAVILSGNASDGTLGAKTVKGGGGIVLAQEPTTAGFPSMPSSAIEASCVDRVLPPAEIADELLKLSQRARQFRASVGYAGGAAFEDRDAQRVLSILRLLSSRTRVDFSVYKPTTIRRRLLRQMMLSKCNDLGEYLKLLQKDRGELDKLYESMLITVTEFFRDPVYFEFLRENVLPHMLRRHTRETPFRVWIPGCATGEEVYSFAIVLHELFEAKELPLSIQIFGTDVGDRAIAVARAEGAQVAQGCQCAGRTAAPRPRSHAHLPPVCDPKARDDQPGTAGGERGDPVEQRGTAVDQRGTRDRQGGTAVDERGTDDRQRGVAQPAGRTDAAQ